MIWYTQKKMEKRVVIFVPGLGDEVRATYLATLPWRLHGFNNFVYPAPWNDTTQSLEEKLKKFKSFLRSTYKKPVFLVGASAGASFVLNTMYENPDLIDKAVALCGRLRSGKDVSPTLDQAAKRSSAFKESVSLFERRTPELTPEFKQKILTVRSLNDYVVPEETAKLDGVKNIITPLPFHVPSIYGALTIFNKEIIDFLKD